MKNLFSPYYLFLLLLLGACAEPKKETTTITAPIANDTLAAVLPQKEIPVAAPLEKQSPPLKRKQIATSKSAPAKELIFLSNEDLVNQRAMDSLYRVLAKAPEIFTINNSSDTILVCKEGTKIYLPANCFLDKNNKPVNDVVQLEVREYYSRTDMVFASLNSVSDGNLMESGGMLNLQAKSNGENLSIAKSKTVDIEMPTQLVDPRMELFYGHGHDRRLNWKLGKTNRKKQLSSEKFKKTISTKVSCIIKNKELSIMEDSLQYPIKGFRRFTNPMTSSLPSELIVTQNSLLDTVVISFEMDRKGKIKNQLLTLNGKQLTRPSIRSGHYVANPLNPSVHTFRPSENDLQFSHSYEFNYSIRRKEKYHSLPLSNNEITLDEEDLKKMRKLFSKADTTITVKLQEVYICANDKLIDKAMKEQLARTENGNSTNVSDIAVKYYVFNLNALGWINCDRFMNTPKEDKTTYRIAHNDSKSDDVKIHFTNINALMNGSTDSRAFNFDNIPKNMKITVIGIRHKNNRYELALKNTSTSQTSDALQYTPVASINELKEKIAEATK